MRILVSFCCLGLLTGLAPAAGPDDGFVPVDYAKIPRCIRKEPRYVAQPRYALFIFDPQAKFRVWAVLDKSKSDLPYYDVLYLDKNGDGDLTEPGKRFVGHYEKYLPSLSIPVGDLPIPGTNLVHTDLRFLTVEQHGYKGIWFAMKWAGRDYVDGGYGNGTDTTVYATSAAKAPILRPTPLGPLSFRSWEPKLTLRIGKVTDVQISLGNPGSGPDTFCVVGEHYLVPGKDVIVATLLAKDRAGRVLRVQQEFKKHC